MQFAFIIILLSSYSKRLKAKQLLIHDNIILLLNNSQSFSTNQLCELNILCWLMMPRGKAAEIIVDAIHAKKPEEVVTWHGKALVFASKHLWRTTRFFLQRGFKLRKDVR